MQRFPGEKPLRKKKKTAVKKPLAAAEGGNGQPSAGTTIVHKPIHAEKYCLGELIWASITEGAPEKMVWGINLGIGS